MQYLRPTVMGTLIKRYKRFLADIELETGEVITAHCPNSGAMTTCSTPGSPVMVVDMQSPTRKLRYTWELIQMDDTWVGVNTSTPNAAVHHFVTTQQIPELAGYDVAKREVKYGTNSRIDLLLTRGLEAVETCHVEIKNTTLRDDAHAAFPDAVTTRGQKHLRELTLLAEAGQRAVMFYFMGRSDVTRFRPADEVDPEYGQLLRRAVDAGVEVLPYRMAYSPEGVAVLGRAEVDL